MGKVVRVKGAVKGGGEKVGALREGEIGEI